MEHSIPHLDLEQYAKILHPESSAYVSTPRSPHPDSVSFGALLESDEPFVFTAHVDYKDLIVELSAALSGLGKIPARDLGEEVLQLARFFISLTGDPGPRVDLRVADSQVETAAETDGAMLTLKCSLLGSSTRTVTVGKAPPPTKDTNRTLHLTLTTDRAPIFPGIECGPHHTLRRNDIAAQDVVLVSMPFAPLTHPSLGLSLLQSALVDIDSEVLYFTMPFAERIGVAFYAWVCGSNPSEEALTGEWIFSEHLDEEAVAKYTREILGDLSADLIDELHMVRAKVGPFLEDCVSAVLAREPKIVGFTSMFQQHQASLALARRLKQADPELTVLFGGANNEGRMGLETVRSFDFVDVVVSGEADLVIHDLVGRLLRGEGIAEIQGVYTAKEADCQMEKPSNAESVTLMDQLPRASFEDFFRQWNAIPAFASYSPRLLMETSRGCWWGAKHHCTFCGLNGVGMPFRSKSPERAIDELTELMEQYPNTEINMVDNILDMSYFKTLLPTLAERGAPVELFFETKANLTKAQVAILRKAGITSIQPGIESFSDEILRIMRKGVTGLQNIQLLKWCLELGVWPYWNLLWGFPGEPREEYEEMAELLPRLHHLPPPEACGPLRLDRFSPNFDRAEELGFRDVTPFQAYQHLYDLDRSTVANLAYYFDFEYQDGRRPADYTGLLAERMEEWRAAYRQSRLVFIDKGEDLLIWDLRGSAVRKLTMLSSLERTLYLECDSIRGLNALRKIATRAAEREFEAEEIEEILTPWVRDGLMLRQGAQFLALAVPEQSN